jgi:hypothetical protein
MRSMKGTRFLIAGVALVLLGMGTLYVQRNAVFDWWRLRGYTPSPAIVNLAHDTTMTTEGRTLFYINHPMLDDRVVFSKVCPSGSEQTIVLGCYHPVQRGIYLYDVSDTHLNGVEQVTVAHEMLHAAYDRLSSHERTYVDGLLENYYQHDLHDSTVLTEIAAYKKSEPYAVQNEMHSVFGTEVANLPAPLEQYYKQYFTNRERIVHYTTNYRSAFSSRQAKIKYDDVQLAAIKAQVDLNEKSLDGQLRVIVAMKSQLAAAQASGDINTYNADVPSYNGMVVRYNALVVLTKQRVVQYNKLVIARNAIALEESQLAQALDSKLTSISN